MSGAGRAEGGADPDGASSRAVAGLTVRFWGVRGSVPSPGADTARYGGNTACVELTAPGGRRLVLDAGTGLRPLGDALSAAGAREVAVLVTHGHADHVHGLPFFRPLGDPAVRVTLYAAEAQVPEVEAAVRAVLGPPLFPHADGLRERLRVRAVPADGGVAGFRVRPVAMAHPGGASGFRVTCEAVDRSVAYLPDNELAAAEGACGGRRAMLEAVAGVDALIHDATYLPAELAAHRGWGHSSYAEAVRLAADAGVRRLVLFHHAPGRADAEVDRIARTAAAIAAASRGAPAVLAAAEGDVLVV